MGHVKRALISVHNKKDIVPLAQGLIKLGIEIISTGGTRQVLEAAQIPVREVSELTGFPEIMNGRVKTLHPKIHGGILGLRDKHISSAEMHDIAWIDLVIVNLYPFRETTRDEGASFADAIENIDIGGPTLIRGAAKNFEWVGVVVDPDDYTGVLQDLTEKTQLSSEKRLQLAAKAFAHTATYDHYIAKYFAKKINIETKFPDHLYFTFNKLSDLRYGENPHQTAAAYVLGDDRRGILTASQWQGKPLSFNNIVDLDAADQMVNEFDVPACVIVKHANPSGVAIASSALQAVKKAWAADATSAFGGVIALNSPCDGSIATFFLDYFIEALIAPSFTQEALDIFTAKPNVRLLSKKNHYSSHIEFKRIEGGLLSQDKDLHQLTEGNFKVVTKAQPSKEDVEQLLFAWRVLKHMKSNAILIAANGTTLGMGSGQVSRIDAVQLALKKSEGKIKQAVLASDAFFPFRDSIDLLKNSGITAIIQPGGSIRDEEVIAASDELGIALVFTGIRCFRH